MKPVPAPRRRAGPNGATHDHLLTVAGEVFAETGYKAATIRDICRRAGANVAAIHYHFGGKEPLYAEVLSQGFRTALRHFPADGGVPKGAPAAERLRGFIESFLRRIFASGPDSLHVRMLAREMIEPTPVLDTLVAGEVRLLARRLEGILRDLLGTPTTGRFVRNALASVLGQVVFYQHCRPVISRLFPGLTTVPQEVEDLADHITRFSLAGIRAMARADRGPGRRRNRTPSKA